MSLGLAGNNLFPRQVETESQAAPSLIGVTSSLSIDQDLANAWEDLTSMTATFTLENDAFAFISFNGKFSSEDKGPNIKNECIIVIDGVQKTITTRSHTNGNGTVDEFFLATQTITELGMGTHTIKIQGQTDIATDGDGVFNGGEMNIIMVDKTRVKRHG